jgi:hypothetical protein
MRIHGATPEFIRELKALGYDRLPPKAHHHADPRRDPEFIRELKSLGYGLPAQDLVTMRIHGASPSSSVS